MTRRILAVAVVAAAAATVIAAPSDLPMQAPIACRAAGIELSLPQGYQLLVPEAPDAQRPWPVLLQATKSLAGGVSGAAWLEAHVLNGAETLGAAATRLDKVLAASKRYADLKVVARPPIRSGHVSGLGRLYSFHSGGRAAWAARVYFLRELTDPAVRVCYVLTVAAPAGHQAGIVPDLRAVIRAITLTDVEKLQESSDVPIVPFRSATSELLLAVPVGWYVVPRDKGVGFRQVDLLGGGKVIEVGEAMVIEAPAGASPEMLNNAAEGSLRKIGLTRHKVETWRLHPSETMLGPLKAHELVLHQYPEAGQLPVGDAGVSMPSHRCIVIRTALARRGRTPIAFIVTAILPGRDPLAVKRRMKALAATFALRPMPAAATQPAQEPKPPAPEPVVPKLPEPKPAPLKIPPVPKPVAPKAPAPQPLVLTLPIRREPEPLPAPLVIPDPASVAPREAPMRTSPARPVAPAQPQQPPQPIKPVLDTTAPTPPQRPGEPPLAPSRRDLPPESPPDQAKTVFENRPQTPGEIEWEIRTTPKEASPVARQPREVPLPGGPAKATPATPALSKQPVRPIVENAVPARGVQPPTVPKLPVAKGKLPDAKPDPDLPIFEVRPVPPKVTTGPDVIVEPKPEPKAPPEPPAPAKPTTPPAPKGPAAPAPPAGNQLRLQIGVEGPPAQPATPAVPPAPTGGSGTLQLGIDVKEAPVQPAKPVRPAQQDTPLKPAAPVGAGGRTRPVPISIPVTEPAQTPVKPLPGPGRPDLPKTPKTPTTQPARPDFTTPADAGKTPPKDPLELRWD